MQTNKNTFKVPFRVPFFVQINNFLTLEIGFLKSLKFNDSKIKNKKEIHSFC